MFTTENSKNFVVYRSGAGSGKTFTLVKEYLRLALYDDKKLNYNFKRILAITFTNKAAAEMKSRVLVTLEAISNPNTPFPFIGTLLCQELQLNATELQQRAAQVLSSLLHNYSDFAIGTIDSFTHKIVKTFAHDLKLPVNFNVELDTKSFYDKVIARLFNQVGEDAGVSHLLKEFVLSKAESNSYWDPQKQLEEFTSLLQKENSEEYVNRLKNFDADTLESFRKQFNEYVRHYESTLQQVAGNALELISQHKLSDDDFKYKKNGPQNFFKKCYNATVLLTDASGSYLSKAIELNDWGSSPKVKELGAQFTQIALELINFIKENYPYYSLCKVLAGQMYSLMLLKKIEEISLDQKQEERLVFISEFNQRIFDIVNNEPAPFVYERLGERYRHFLLDEFQDNSSLQWQNILPLLDNSLSNGWYNLVVGDGKQSIYRWRNANVKQFDSLPSIENNQNNSLTTERQKNLERNFKERLLNSNYRSSRNIVEFNNHLFHHLSQQVLTESNKSIYRSLQQQVSNSNAGEGYVSINTSLVERTELDMFTFTALSEHIAKALQDGFNYSDICILARQNTQGNLIADYLMQQGIPVVSSESLLLKNHPAITVVISFLKYLENTADTINAAIVITHLWHTKRLSNVQYHQALEQAWQQGYLFQLLKSCGIKLFEEQLALNNLGDNCIAIIEALELNQHAFHYIRFFLDEVNEFITVKNQPGLSFFSWWETRRQKASLIIPEGANAVKIMTIHASKGLEFPVVIVPYCNWLIYRATNSWVNVNHEKVSLPVSVVNLTKKSSEAGFEKEVEEEQEQQTLDNLNLLYVAFTRAANRLHILSNTVKGSTGVRVNAWLIQFVNSNTPQNEPHLFELGTLQAKEKMPSHSRPHDVFELQALEFSTDSDTVKIKNSYLLRNSIAQEAKQHGILLHKLLAGINSREDIPSVLKRAITDGEITHLEVETLRQKLYAIVQHPQLIKYFEIGVTCKKESEVVTANGEVLRPDRVVFLPEEVIIIDYKTGSRNDKKHSVQLNSYENALAAMGYSCIKKFLIYTDTTEVVGV